MKRRLVADKPACGGVTEDPCGMIDDIIRTLYRAVPVS